MAPAMTRLGHTDCGSAFRRFSFLADPGVLLDLLSVIGCEGDLAGRAAHVNRDLAHLLPNLHSEVGERSDVGTNRDDKAIHYVAYPVRLLVDGLLHALQQ